MASQGVFLNTLDPRSLSDLKYLAKTEEHSDEALKAASKQIEGLFLQMMLKAMRDASPSDPLTNSEETRMAQSLHDQQLASNLAQSGGTGLADALFRQLGGGREHLNDGALPSADFLERPDITLPRALYAAAMKHRDELSAVSEQNVVAVQATRAGSGRVPANAREFVNEVWPHALEASQKTGIPAHFMVAQAALETGWGAHQIKNVDGSPSHNLFNIKANKSWEGATTASTTTLEHGKSGWQQEKSAFRSYDSYAEAFDDYARLLTENRRYQGVVGADDARTFATGLQKAGYATDPMYANKLMRIIGGSTLRNALAPDGVDGTWVASGR